MSDVALRDCGRWLSGGTPDTENPSYWGGDIPWITSSSLKGRYLDRSLRQLTKEGVASGSRLVGPGTLIFVVRGMSLKNEFRVGISTRPLAFGQDCKALVPAEGIDSKYLLFALEAAEDRVLRMVDEASHGTGRLQTSLLGSLEVRVPPLEEQRRIAEILDTIDKTIQATERVIAKLDVAHEGLRRESVPQCVGDGVEEVPLGDLIDPLRPIAYGILMPGDHVSGGVPVIKVRDIRGGVISERRTLLHTSPKIDEEYARSRVREGDVLFTIRGTVGRTALVPSSLDGANITQDTARLAVSGVNRSYLLAAMAADVFRRFVDVHTIGQAVKGINLRELRKAPVLLLPRDQQEVVGATLDDSLGWIDAELARLDKLRLTRSALAADLLSGRVRTVAA